VTGRTRRVDHPGERVYPPGVSEHAVTIASPLRRFFTRAEYERAAELGLFGPEERLELIGGEVLQRVTPQHSLHATGVTLAAETLRQAFGQGYVVRVQLPLALADDSEPEPDVAVVAGEIRDYKKAHPSTAVLVVEVADTTLEFDRGRKAGLYAAAGITEYWVLNLQDRVLEVHREPAPMVGQPFGHHYRSITRHPHADSLHPLAAPAAAVNVGHLIP